MGTQNKGKNISIEKPYIILCEGTDDKKFLDYYLSYLGDACDSKFKTVVQIECFDGVDNLPMSLAVIKNLDGYQNVTNILVVRDADMDVSSATRKVESALRYNGLPIPPTCNMWTDCVTQPNIAYCLMPACSTSPTTGTLEDLCWDILNCEDLTDFKNDIQAFIDMIKTKYNSIGPHEHKSRIHTYFSVNDKFISMKIGEAARAGAFNWDHPRLEPLKTLIESGF